MARVIKIFKGSSVRPHNDQGMMCEIGDKDDDKKQTGREGRDVNA